MLCQFSTSRIGKSWSSIKNEKKIYGIHLRSKGKCFLHPNHPSIICTFLSYILAIRIFIGVIFSFEIQHRNLGHCTQLHFYRVRDSEEQEKIHFKIFNPLKMKTNFSKQKFSIVPTQAIMIYLLTTNLFVWLLKIDLCLSVCYPARMINPTHVCTPSFCPRKADARNFSITQFVDWKIRRKKTKKKCYDDDLHYYIISLFFSFILHNNGLEWLVWWERPDNCLRRHMLKPTDTQKRLT